MDAFVDLFADRQELQWMLEELGLAQPGEVPEPVLLTGGVSSSVFKVDLRSGVVCVKQGLPKLKVEKDWQVPTSRVFAEIDWLTVAQTIIPDHVPQLLGADRVRRAFVMEYFTGLPSWKDELLTGVVRPEIGTLVANALGRVHASTAGDIECAERFANDANFFALRLEPYLVEAARVHLDLAPALIALVHTTQTTPLALVHGDISPKNILLKENGTPVLIDAECAVYGDPAFDLAFLLNHTLLKAAHLSASEGPLLGLYSRIASDYLPHIRWEDPCDFDRRCARMIGGLMLARIDGKSPVEYLDETARTRVRATARSLVQSPPDGVKQLLSQWSAVMAEQR